MKNQRTPPPAGDNEALGRPVSAAEEAARTAPRRVISDEEKGKLAAEASRIEDA